MHLIGASLGYAWVRLNHCTSVHPSSKAFYSWQRQVKYPPEKIRGLICFVLYTEVFSIELIRKIISLYK